MAPLHVKPITTKVLFLLVLFVSTFVSHSSSLQPTFQLLGRRELLEKNYLQEDSDDDHVIQAPIKKKSISTSIAQSSSTQSKNKTKLIKPTSTTSNSTKTNKIQEKPILKKVTNSTSLKLTKPTSKTTNVTLKSSNSTKNTNSTKPISKNTNSTKPISKNTKPNSNPAKKPIDQVKKTTEKKSTTKQVKPLTYQLYEDEDDFVSDFKDLPSRFQETFIPDLEVLSTTSKAYLNKANKQISKNFNPYVGKKYAPIIASIISFLFILIPFLLVSLIFHRIRAYFSLQKLIIFIQIYLAIYFSILSISSIVTGLEPLKFFYATSQSTYICVQLLQTLAYVLYLVVLLMYLVLVFSSESSVVSKMLGFGQTFVGFGVGLHYYVTVFHRAVLRQPPKTSWKVHGVYATCFLLICLLGTAERRKKAYVVDGSEEEGKKS